VRDHMRAMPSYEPVASRLPSPFQSSVVTSLLCWFLSVLCGSAVLSGDPRPRLRSQMRAVESPELHNQPCHATLQQPLASQTGPGLLACCMHASRLEFSATSSASAEILDDDKNKLHGAQVAPRASSTGMVRQQP
jgi:hypothetical protein